MLDLMGLVISRISTILMGLLRIRWFGTGRMMLATAPNVQCRFVGP